MPLRHSADHGRLPCVTERKTHVLGKSDHCCNERMHGPKRGRAKQFAAFQNAQFARWGNMVKSLNIQVE